MTSVSRGDLAAFLGHTFLTCELTAAAPSYREFATVQRPAPGLRARSPGTASGTPRRGIRPEAGSRGGKVAAPHQPQATAVYARSDIAAQLPSQRDRDGFADSRVGSLSGMDVSRPGHQRSSGLQVVVPRLVPRAVRPEEWAMRAGAWDEEMDTRST